MKFFFIVILLVFASCETKEDTELVDIGFLTISFGQNLDIKKIENGFILNSRDTFVYNQGINVSSLTEIDPEVIYLPPNSNKIQDNEMLEKLNSLKNTIIVRERQYDIDKYRKQNVTYYEIDKRILKYTYPRGNEGITGIYLDSIYYGCQGDVCGNISFNLYGNNISDKSIKALKKSIKTIKIKEGKE